MKGFSVSQETQIYLFGGLIAIYFRKFGLAFAYVMYKSLFMKRPTFREIYIATQFAALRSFLPKIMKTIGHSDIFDIFRPCLQITISTTRL